MTTPHSSTLPAVDPAVDPGSDIDRAAPYRPGFAEDADVDLFVDTLERFERGEVSADDWRGFRLVNGVYGQRQEGVQMVRVKLPLGLLSAAQLHAAGEVAERWSNGKGHITTRQNIQFHFVPTDAAETVLRFVADAGITTREACGNSVRTITGSPWAGIHPAEPFDPTPYGEALTRHLLRGEWSATLPRKFKAAIGGSAGGGDDVAAAINDLGLLVRVKESGERGFRFTIGGGLATFCRTGIVVEEFLPAAELLEAAEAVLRVFNDIGNRDDRNRARLRHAIHTLGADEVIRLYHAKREVIRAEGGRAYTLPPQPPTPVLPAQQAPETAQAGYPEWALHNVKPQKQRGFAAVVLRLVRGDITAAQFHALGDLVATLPEPEVRTTVDQDLLIRFVPQWRLPEVHRVLTEIGLAHAGAGTIEDITSCPGASSCKLAITASRGLAALLGDYLAERPQLAAKAHALNIKISGCPNSCGQHHIAGVGFQGGAKKVGGRLVPLYNLLVGGEITGDGAAFGRVVAKIPARRAPQALERLIDLYAAERTGDETPAAFFRRHHRSQRHARGLH
jgi:sulfite reductase (NADPH) hemoprotein beta-component